MIPGYLLVVAGNCKDSGGNLLNGTLTFQPVLSTQEPTAYRAGLAAPSIAAFDAATPYPRGGLSTGADGNAYVSLADANTGNAPVTISGGNTTYSGLWMQIPKGCLGTGQVTNQAVPVTVVNGAFALLLPDVATTFPSYIGFRVGMQDPISGDCDYGPGYNCFQPTSDAGLPASAQTNGVVFFDNWDPNLAPQVTVQIGPQGISAYQVAVANGFEGTQSQWLASLVGPGTADGVDITPTSVALVDSTGTVQSRTFLAPKYHDYDEVETDSRGRIIYKSSGGVSNTPTSTEANVTVTSTLNVGGALLQGSSQTYVAPKYHNYDEVETDSRGRILSVSMDDGSQRVAALRDGSGNLVSAQIATALSTANTALALAQGSGSSTLRQTLITAQQTWGHWPAETMRTTPPACSMIGGPSQNGVPPAAFSSATLTPWNASTWRPRFAFYGQAANDGSYLAGFGSFYSVRSTGNAGTDLNGGYAATGGSLEFVHTGTKFCIQLRGSGGACRLLINGDRPDNSVYVTNSDGWPWYLTVDFTGSSSAAVARTITVEGNGEMHFGGVYCLSGEGVSLPPGGDRPLMITMGDSLTEGNDSFVLNYSTAVGGTPTATAWLPCGGYAFHLGRLLGTNNVVSGLGGTGWLNPNSTATPPRAKLRDRSLDYTSHPFVLGIWAMGVNDNTYNGMTGTTLRDAIRDEVRANNDLWFAAHAAAPLIAFAPWNDMGDESRQQLFWVRDGIQSAMAEYPLGNYIDNMSPNWITGTGNIAVPTGTGNSDLYFDSATARPHWNAPGHEYIAKRAFNELSYIIRTRF